LPDARGLLRIPAMTADLRSTSKFLSYVLRHHPDALGIELDKHGWVDIDTLMAAAHQQHKPWTRELLEEVVRTNDKQRFRISDDGQRIRANQGHSIGIDLALQPQQPPTVLYHGTADRHLESILANGLHKRTRQHVHLSDNRDTARTVGSRHGRAIVLSQ
jgi:putative RNA 2'-phosphotransferase